MKKKDQKTGVSPSNGKFLAQPLEFWLKMDNLLSMTGFNLALLEPYIRHLLLIDAGTGYHKIEVEVINHAVTFIRGADTQKLDMKITNK